MQYVISDAGVVAVSENSGTLQNVSNDKIEVSHSSDFADCLIVLPLENLAFNSPIFARAVGSVTSPIAFNVVDFIADEVVSGSGTSSGVSGGAVDHSPNLKLNNTIILPNTLTAIWQGGGDLSVSLENNIADYTIDGGNVYFEPKKLVAGEYSTRGAIIIGENNNFDSDCAEFTVAFTSTKKAAPKTNYLLYSGSGHALNKVYYNDTICWVGGDFVSVETNKSSLAAVSVTCGACQVDKLSGLHQLPVTYYATVKSGYVGMSATATLKTTRANYNLSYIMPTVSAVNASYNNNVVGNATSQSQFNLPTIRSDKAAVVNYASKVNFFSTATSLTSNAYMPTNYLNTGDNVRFYLYGILYYGDVYIQSTGNGCQFRIAHSARATINGNNCDITDTTAIVTGNKNIIRGAATVKGDYNFLLGGGSVKGDCCYLKGAGTLAAQSDYCTIQSGGIQYLNDNDVIFGFGTTTGKVYDMGENSTVIYSGEPSISGDDLILGWVTIFGAADNNFVYKIL